jgi:predicted phosphodiesterase
LRLVLISEVQANLHALEAVLAAIDADPDEEDRVICAGDVIGLGPHPNEVLDLIRNRNIETVRGNYDDAVAFERMSSGVDLVNTAAESDDRSAVEWTRRTLTKENMTYLQKLPRDVRVFPGPGGGSIRRDDLNKSVRDEQKSLVARSIFGSLFRPSPLRRRVKKILVVHGSPRALNERIVEESANSILKTIADESRADLLITGHAGMGFRREAAGMTFIGVPGLSGSEAAAGEAEYAVIDLAGGLDVEFRRVPYDFNDYLNAMSTRGLPLSLKTRFAG